jgi:arginyl-tRNA synthetase
VNEPSPDLASLRARVRDAIAVGWERAVASGALPAAPEGVELQGVEVERPANPEHGDFSSNLAMKLARPCRMPPLRIAEAIAVELKAEITAGAHAAQGGAAADEPRSPIASVAVAPPGFLNLRLCDSALRDAVAEVLARPEAWGRVRAARPRHVNVEFVSANPTGPLHIGNARGAFVGDLLCRVFEAAGHRVTREYYFNDFGAQVRNLGASVVAIRRGTELPEDGYRGAYVHDLAREVPAEIWAAAEATTGGGADPEGAVVTDDAGASELAGGIADEDEGADVPGANVAGAAKPGLTEGPARDAAWIVGEWASERVRVGIEASLATLGVRFDVWKSEGSLYREGWVERAVERLRASGHLYEQDGALWFRSTDYGDDKDRVVRKSNGDFTYFGSDIGYVVEKFSRGFDHLVYIWGADHHGTVARLRNAAEAMGFDREAVQMLLTAWVRFVRDGVEVSMSKRAGEFITLDDLLAEIGVDAARWFFAARGYTSGIDFDIELAKKQSNENPVYYVQYAHARIASILRKASEVGLAPDTGVAAGSLGDPSTPEGALARALARFPEVVEDAAAAEETQGITAFATDLATQFHAFYRDARVVDPAEPERSASRLALVRATQLTLAGALRLLGISAPESM